MSSWRLLPLLIFAGLLCFTLLLAQDRFGSHTCTHRSSGNSVSINLTEVTRAQKALQEAQLLNLDELRSTKTTGSTRSVQPLPACRSSRSFNKTLDAPVSAKVIGTELLFISHGQLAQLNSHDKAAAILVDSGDVRTTLEALKDQVVPRRGIYLGSSDLYRTLGVTCFPTRVAFKGKDHVLVKVGSR